MNVEKQKILDEYTEEMKRRYVRRFGEWPPPYSRSFDELEKRGLGSIGETLAARFGDSLLPLSVREKLKTAK